MNISNDRIIELMKEVMKEVDIAIEEGNSPFAAFLLDINGNIIFKDYNTCNSEVDPTAHAEMNLIRKACKKLNTKDLSDYILISNAESCSMCFSAAIKAKINKFIFGSPSEINMNPYITIYDIKDKTKQELIIITGILENECKKQIEEARNK